MTHFIDVLAVGLSTGVIYALIALGFATIYRATGVLNFAHGSLLLGGAALVAVLSEGLGFWLALGLGVVAVAAAGLAMDRAVFRWVSSTEHVRLAVITLGVDAVALALLSKWIGTRVLAIADPWGDQTIGQGDFFLPTARVAGAVIAFAVLVCFFLVLRYTHWGLSMRAATEDAEAASLVGVRSGRISASAWMIGGGLATLAGVFLCVFPTPGVAPTVHAFALKAFPAAVLGGLGSFGGVVAGGMVIGIAEALAAGYAHHLTFLGPGFSAVVPWMILFVVLLVRPNGLFNKAEMQRV